MQTLGTRRYPARLHAFTLVELLVVIGIIALLISILLPSLSRARFAAKIVACASNHHQVYLATAMYANDNKGNLPGCNGMWGCKGADLITSYGAYPWEYSDFWLTNTLPGTPSGVVRPFGIGQLVALKYLPVSTAIGCGDFYTQSGQNVFQNDTFTFTQSLVNDQLVWNGPNQGSLLLNSIPYYQTNNGTNDGPGKLGRPGRNGGYWTNGLYNVDHITALIQCLTTDGTFPDDGSICYPTITHQRRGINVTYMDGHTVWQPMSERDWKTADDIAYPASNGTGMQGGYFFWAWATKME